MIPSSPSVPIGCRAIWQSLNPSICNIRPREKPDLVIGYEHALNERLRTFRIASGCLLHGAPRPRVVYYKIFPTRGLVHDARSRCAVAFAMGLGDFLAHLA